MEGTTPANFSFPVNTPPGVDRSVRGARPAPAPSVAESLAARRADSVDLSSRAMGAKATPAAAPSSKVSKLVAASVAVPVNFEVSRPVANASAGALPLYRHPADRNIAATGVSLGRRVDVTG